MRGCSRDFAASKRVPLGHSSQQALVTIKQAADAFKAKGNARITATGHTGTSGPESYNTSGVRRRSGKAAITGRFFSFEREHVIEWESPDYPPRAKAIPRAEKRAWRLDRAAVVPRGRGAACLLQLAFETFRWPLMCLASFFS